MSRLVPYVVFSVVCHGGLSLFLQHVERPQTVALRQQPVEFVSFEPPNPEPPKPEPPPPEPRVEAPEPQNAVPKSTPRSEPQPPRVAAEVRQSPIAETAPAGPVRLTGVKFSNAGTFALHGGGGPGSAAPATLAAPAAEERPSSRLVGLADLSQRPTPPKLDARLQANYPRAQRQMGTEGEALLELVLSERGEVVDAKIRSQTSPPFGAACRKTLLGTRWSPPVDGAGRAVRTRLSYRCSFRVTS